MALKKCLSTWKEAAVHLVEKTVIIGSKIRASKTLELFIAGVRAREPKGKGLSCDSLAFEAGFLLTHPYAPA